MERHREAIWDANWSPSWLRVSSLQGGWGSHVFVSWLIPWAFFVRLGRGFHSEVQSSRSQTTYPNPLSDLDFVVVTKLITRLHGLQVQCCSHLLSLWNTGTDSVDYLGWAGSLGEPSIGFAVTWCSS